jgi:hypothetical protein
MKLRGVLFAAAAAVFVAVPGLGGAATQPTVRLQSRAPVVVSGSSFRAGEQVAVVLSSEVRRSKKVTANARGGFTVRFAVSLDRCARLSIQAFGSTGSRARLVRTRSLDCVAGA